MLERILAMTIKEFRQVLRDQRTRTVLIVPPIVQLILFGFAVNLDVDEVRTAWMDNDRTVESRDLRAAFAGSRNFRIVYEPRTGGDVRCLLDRGLVHLVVCVERGFGADLERGRVARVQLILDGTNSNTAWIVAGYSQRVLARFARKWAARRQGVALYGASAVTGGPVRPVLPDLRLQTRVWFNPNLKSRDYFVPGVIALVITVTTLTLTALAVVREKEIGTMEQLMVTPLRPLELILGKTFPFALVGLFDVLLVTTLALVIFRVPLRGNVLILFVGAGIYVLATLGLGLFVSTLSRTQQQAMMLSFFFVFPIVLLSGFAFPIANMPKIIQWATYANPMRYFLEIVRFVFLKGVGVKTLWPQFAAMAVLGFLIFIFCAVRFQKRLD